MMFDKTGDKIRVDYSIKIIKMGVETRCCGVLMMMLVRGGEGWSCHEEVGMRVLAFCCATTLG
jgi:hypothetical protein